MSRLPPSPKAVEAALRRVEQGTATIADARLLRRHIAELEGFLRELNDELKDLRDADIRYSQAMSEVFNTGNGAYRP